MRRTSWPQRAGRRYPVSVNTDLAALLAAHDGVLTRADVLAHLPHHILDHATRSGALMRIFPRTYLDPALVSDGWARARAALRYAGPDAALSHLTALGVWKLPGGTGGCARDCTGGGGLPDPVHVLVPLNRRPRATTGLVVHRRRGFDSAGRDVVQRRGLATCRVEPSVIDSWPLLRGDTRRAAVIASVSERLTTPARLRTAVGENVNLKDRFELLRLVNLLDQGCRSELELWGYDHVFSGPDMPPIVRNLRVRVGQRSVYLDAYCPRSRVNFELDGAKWHSSRAARERDARRDAALAAMGIMVVRFTHDQLVRTPELVRDQIRSIVAARLSHTGTSP
jgi:hypothetical protein